MPGFELGTLNWYAQLLATKPPLPPYLVVLLCFKNNEKIYTLKYKSFLSNEYYFLSSTGISNLKECIKGAKHIQECVFEDVELKKKVGHILFC